MTWGTKILGLLAVLSVLMSGTIPQGWMPASNSGGKILLVLCTGDGTVEQWIDPSSGEPVHNDADERPACPFAGAWIGCAACRGRARPAHDRPNATALVSA